MERWVRILNGNAIDEYWKGKTRMKARYKIETRIALVCFSFLIRVYLQGFWAEYQKKNEQAHALVIKLVLSTWKKVDHTDKRMVGLVFFYFLLSFFQIRQ